MRLSAKGFVRLATVLCEELPLEEAAALMQPFARLVVEPLPPVLCDLDRDSKVKKVMHAMPKSLRGYQHEFSVADVFLKMSLPAILLLLAKRSAENTSMGPLALELDRNEGKLRLNRHGVEYEVEGDLSQAIATIFHDYDRTGV